MKLNSRHHRVWWHLSDNGLHWLVRPWCWVLGYHRPHHCDVYFEMCWFCGRSLWSRKRHGGNNPYIKADRSGYIDRAPATWRLLGKITQDIHDGVISGFDKIWYG